MNTLSIKEQSLEAQEEHLYRVMSGERFLNMKGLANEVPFFIYAYPPEQAIDVERGRNRLTGRLKADGIGVTEINLYEMSLKLLSRTRALDRILDSEEALDKGALLEVLQNLLDPENRLSPAIAEELKDDDSQIIFITGVGEVFPFIRSHNVLNNLQSVIKDKPMLMYFPGSYTQSETLGSALVLFNRLKDDQYYRAKDILEQEP